MTSYLQRGKWALVVVLALTVIGCKSERSDTSQQAETRHGDAPTDDIAATPKAEEPWQKELVAKCTPSVVNWRILHYPNSGWYVGSGVVLHESGYALVCAHVYLTPQAGLPSVFLADGSQHPCRIIAFCSQADVCLVKVETDAPLVPVRFAANGTPQPGLEVLAFGQPKGKLHTRTWAQISRLNIGPEERFELVGGKIGPGFSGGAVVDRNGEFVGLINDDDKGVACIGKAVPVQRVRREMEQRFAEIYGRADHLYRYRLGIHLLPVREPKVTAVGGPAAQAGVKVGDVLVRIGDVRIDDAMHYYIALLELKSANPVPIVVQRDGERLELSIAPAQRGRKPAVGPLREGLRMRTLAGSFGPVLNFNSRGSDAKVVPTIDIEHVGNFPEGVTVRFDGYVSVPADGTYTFDIEADLGGSVTVAGVRVAVRDEMSGPEAHTTPIDLQAGLHAIVVAYYHVSGKFHEDLPRKLKVFYQGPGLPRQPIPAEALFTAQPQPTPVTSPDAEELPRRIARPAS
jgi:S1-C subfamily serine protease